MSDKIFRLNPTAPYVSKIAQTIVKATETVADKVQEVLEQPKGEFKPSVCPVCELPIPYKTGHFQITTVGLSSVQIEQMIEDFRNRKLTMFHGECAGEFGKEGKFVIKHLLYVLGKQTQHELAARRQEEERKNALRVRCSTVRQDKRCKTTFLPENGLVQAPGILDDMDYLEIYKFQEALFQEDVPLVCFQCGQHDGLPREEAFEFIVNYLDWRNNPDGGERKFDRQQNGIGSRKKKVLPAATSNGETAVKQTVPPTNRKRVNLGPKQKAAPKPVIIEKAGTSSKGKGSKKGGDKQQTAGK